MFKSLTVISLVAIVLAQDSIPTGISTSCSNFLGNLTADADLLSCTTALTTALSAFSPGAGGTATSADVTSALASVCGPSITSSCPQNVLNSKLTDFVINCPDELNGSPNGGSPNAVVVGYYDALYTLPPWLQALCTKDDSGNSCVRPQTFNATSAQSIKNALYTQDGPLLTLNPDTLAAKYLPFLGYGPELNKSALCVACTRNILSAYIGQESDIPNGIGLSKSPLLNTQSVLFAAVESQCGSTFMEGEVKAAGGLSSSNILGGSSGAVPIAEFQGFVTAFAGFATLAVTALL